MLQQTYLVMVDMGSRDLILVVPRRAGLMVRRRRDIRASSQQSDKR